MPGTLQSYLAYKVANKLSLKERMHDSAEKGHELA